MSHFTLDPATCAELGKATGPLKLCDPTGKILGQFIPEPGRQRKPQISDEELCRREKKGGGRPFADFLAELDAK